MADGVCVMKRYARQIILPEIGTEGQSKLRRARVLVVGAGGLGCPVLQYLVGAGVGQITVLDPDIVEESNLHRQPLYTMSDLGRPKVLAARDHLLDANPASSLQAHMTSLHPGNAAELVNDAEVVVDAADSFAVTYTLSDACKIAGVPLISASVLGQSGYAGGFCGPAPSVHAIFPDLPARAGTCASAGVMGPVVGMTGTVQAQMVLQIILGHAPSPLGRIVTFDASTWHVGGFCFTGTPEPEHSFSFVGRADICGDDHVIELRTEEEARDTVTSQAERWSVETMPDFVPRAGRRVVLCCATGMRAWHAASILNENGITNTALLAIRCCE